jgi:hypothetical protein
LTDSLTRRRDSLTAAFLFFATAAFVFWQNTHIAVLWDLSYLLDTSWRIAIGQVPYRDFPLVHPPLTFVIQALIMRVFGRMYLWPVLHAALVGGLGTVVAWRIALRVLSYKVRYLWPISLLLAAPLVFLGIYGIYPHPIYDCDCAFAIVVALYSIQRLDKQDAAQGWRTWAKPALAGFAVVLPVFFKQNMGGPFLLVVVAGVVFLLAIGVIRRSTDDLSFRAVLLRFLTMAIACLAAGLLILQSTVGLNNYLQWTVHFAAQRRLPGFDDMLSVYRQPSFFWTIPTLGAGLLLLYLPWAQRIWVRLIALCLMATPFVASLVFVFLDDDLDERADNLLSLWPLLLVATTVFALAELRKGITLNRLLPFFVLAAIHGTFLSQQLWGSTYAIWPLLIVLIAQMLAALPAAYPKITLAFAAILSATFLVCGSLYAIGHDRLNYIQASDTQVADGPLYHSTLPALRGMADRGPYLADFEELVHFAEREIPQQDGILLLPGEEPFFYATGRTPQFPVQIFDNTTDPYTPEQLLEETRKRNIRWVIVKTRLQSTEDPLPARDQTTKLVTAAFSKYAQLNGYDIYRRR